MGGCCREAGPSLEDQPGSFEVQSAIKQLHPRLELWQIKADLSECEEVKSNRSFHLLMYEYLFRFCPQPCLYRTLTDILTAGANLSWEVHEPTDTKTLQRLFYGVQRGKQVQSKQCDNPIFFVFFLFFFCNKKQCYEFTVLHGFKSCEIQST